MLHIGISTKNQLLALLQRIETYKKTGKLVITQNNAEKEIYMYHGHIVAVVTTHEHEPLIRRFIRAKMLSLTDLQNMPANIGRILSQSSQNAESYSDVKIAKIVMKLGLVNHEQILNWLEQETMVALEQLLGQPIDNGYFEEGIQPPIGHICTFLIDPSVEFSVPEILDDLQSHSEVEQFIPETPIPFQAEPSYTNLKPTMPIVPVTPSGFVRLPKLIEDTQTNVHNAVSAIMSFPLPNYPLTARVATPPRPNPLFRWETLLIIGVLLIAGLAHGINMFHFPYFENDEGTYMSQAWSVVYEGKLAPYTYWYDHAPGGWLQIAIWTIITGGFHTFGSIINSGRVLMLIMQIGSTLILYYIARNISRSITIAILVALFFALSPYGIYYHRRILIDNVMTFWMLLSILPLVAKKISLRGVWLSAVSLGISILSKEVAVFIIPVIMYLVFFRSHKSHRWYALMGWIALVSSILSLYLLYSVLKGELFPSGTLLGGTAPHVSLIGTLQYQASRGKDGGIFDVHSGFWNMISQWMYDDPFLVGVGSSCMIISILVLRWNRLVGIMGLITLSLWIFLGRGGEIIGFYLVPLLPCLALNIGLVIGLLFDTIKKKSNFGKPTIILLQLLRLAIIIACFITLLGGYSSSDAGLQQNHLLLWNGKQADAQDQAISWVKAHISPNSIIVVDDSSWTDLYDTNTSTSFKNVQWYWKVDLDPAIKIGVFHNNWRNIDYMIVSDQMLHDAKVSQLTLVQTALAHSTTLVRFDTGSWPIEIRQVNK